MKFSIGDKVLLRRTGEEGRVVAFLSKTMMEVEVEGTHFPVYNDEVEHPYLKWFTEGATKAAQKKPVENISPEKANQRPVRLPRGIYLSFIPQFASDTADDIIELFRLHLINETADDIRFQYEARMADGTLLFGHRGSLHAYGNLYLHPIKLDDMNDQPRLHWAVAPASNNKVGLHGDTLRIRAGQLARYIQQMLDENQPSFNVLLTVDAEAVIPKDSPLPELVVKATSKPEIILHTRAETVLDLHAKEAGLNATRLTPQELLDAKVILLQKKLQAAMAAGLSRMIVIHGIGNGSLRDAVHRTLVDTEGINTFSNHWMGGYGWGATEIIFS